MADLKTTNIYGDAYINNKVGIATNAPATRLQIGQLLPTAATEGIQFGDDTSARIYRDSSTVIKVSGGFTSTTYINAGNYLQTSGNLIYPASQTATQRLEVGNASGNAWIDGLTIAQGGNVTVYNNLTTPTATVSGYITFPNDTTAAGLINTAGTAWLRLDDASGNMHMGNSQSGAGIYCDSNAFYWRTANAATTLMSLSGNGDLGAARYLSGTYVTTSDDTSSTTVSYIMAKFGDNYHRSAPAAKVAAFLNNQTMSIAGNAATATALTSMNISQFTNNSGYLTSAVTSAVAGTGISVSGATGAVTITNSSPNATHTGDVTGATALTIANDAVTTVKILNSNVTLAKIANITSGTILGNNNASAPAAPFALTTAQVATMLSGQTMNIVGTSTNITAYTINQNVGTANSPTFATLQLTRLNFGATGATPFSSAAGEGTGNGITFGGDEAGLGYRIFTSMENIGGNYSKLTFNWHTGIRIGAYYGYGGTRFYNNSAGSGTEIFSVGNLDSNVRVVNSLIVNGITINQERATNARMYGTTTGAFGLLGVDSAGSFRWQIYGDASSHGFLDSTWGNWDIKKTINGELDLRVSSALVRVLNSGNAAYAYNMNQYVRTTDTCSFAALTVSNTITGAVSGNAGTVTNGLYTTGGQTIAGITYFSNGESINAYGIRGRFTNEYLHLYNKVGIGSPNGWGQGETSTPIYGLSTYGGLNIAYGDNGISTFNGVIRANSNIRQGADLAMPLSSWSVAGTSTGMVIFSFPGNTSNYGMVHCVFDIYEYNSNTVSTVIVGGHNWNGGWYNTGANVIGRCGKSVRLGVKDSKYCVVFGGAASSWEYGTIILRKIHNGGFYTGVMDMGGSFTTQQTATESFSNISGDLRLLRTSADFIADGGISGTTGTFSGELNIAGNYQIRNTIPTITFRDTDHRTGFIHVNSNIFYILTGVADSGYGNWTQVANSRWPLELNLSTNNAVFGADVNAISFTGAGTGLTGTAASLTAGAVTNGVYTNTNNTLTGINTINNTSNTVINNQSGNLGLTMYQATAGTDAYMTFHIGSDFAAYFGLGGAENDLVYGGWSVGNVRHRILHSGNAPYAWNMNQYVRTTDSPTFNTVTANITGNAYNNLSNNYKDIYVYGDVNTYYVVLIQGESLYSFGRYSVTRGYNWTGPDTWHVASHKGGLTLDWEWSGDTAWGGNDKAIRIIEFNESYSTMVAGLGYPVNGGVIIWLRGGGVNGALYRIRTPIGSNSTVTIYDNLSIAGHVASTTFTAANSAVFSTRADVSNVSAEILVRYPVRATSGLYVDNNAVLHAGNYNSYSPTLTGTGASGTWGISVTGNAGTATILQTARNINGTSFNGSAAITTATWGTARTLTIGSTGKSVDGSAAITWSLAEIGAAATNQTMFVGTTSVAINRASAAQTLTGVSIDGNAATATGQQGGVHFTLNTGGIGYGLVGIYDPDKHQGLFAMGAAYTLAAGGTLANFYGVSWSYDYAGRQLNTGYNLQHCMAVANAGVVATVIGLGIWTNGLIRANGAISSAGTITAAAFSGPLTGNVTGNATTATALTSMNISQFTNNSGYLTSVTNISGNAATATTTDNINGRAFYNRNSGNALAQDSYANNGIGYVTSVSLFSQTDGGMYASAYDASWVHQIYGDFRTGQIAIRGKNSGTWQAFRRVLDETNASYAWNMNQNVRTTDTCSFAGLTVSNTINGSVTGNAGGSSTSCTGNAATATTATSAGSINSDTGNVGGNRLQYWQVSGNTTLNPDGEWYNAIRMGHGDPVTYYGNTLAVRMTGGNLGDIYTRTLTNGTQGSWNRFWHNNNDGAGSGLDADLVDGKGLATAGTADTIVLRDGSGHITGQYILGSYFNASAGNSENPTIGQIWTQNTTDNYLRKSTPAHFRSQVTDGSYPSLTGANASGTWSINITGNAGTATSATTATALSSMNISQFTNNSGYLTSVTNISGNAATATLATKASTLSQGGGNGTGMTFNWSGQGGQPTWLWGSNDGSNIYVWNPSNFSVNYATSAGSATSAGTATSAGSATTAGSCSGNAATATNVAASGITGQTGMWTSAARPGPYRLYRNDDNSAYNVQLTWQAHRTNYWSLRGYLNDGFHAECFVVYSGYADSAGSAGALTTGNTYQVASLGIGVAASNPLHINGDGVNPTIRIDNTAFGSGTSSSRGFFGWLPISMGVHGTKYIQLYS